MQFIKHMTNNLSFNKSFSDDHFYEMIQISSNK